MDSIQRQTKTLRSLPYGYYHLCSDGWQKGKLFHTTEQYAFGAAGLALSTLKFGVNIYSYELMPNHFHILLDATGHQCLDIFYFLVRRINKKLREAGLPCLPDNYWFKLVPVENKEQMRDLVIYLARNKYEKGICTPFGHMWGTGYLVYNQMAQFITGKKVRDMPVRDVERLVGCRIPLPADWEIHPVLGVLPKNFVKAEKILDLFPSVKDYLTRMVKQYESIVKIADTVGEDMDWSDSEVYDVLYKLSGGKQLRLLSAEEKCKLAVQADILYHFPIPLLSRHLQLSEYVIQQVLRSKDYGLRRIK